MSGTTGTGTGTSLTGGIASSSSIPNVLNFNPSVNLIKWRRAKSRNITGVANSRILCVGDSTTFGIGSNTATFGGSLSGGWMANSLPQRLTDYLNKGSLTSTSNSFSGGGNSSITEGRGDSTGGTTGDPRLSFGANWTVDPFRNETLGGGFFRNSGAAGTLAFTPTLNTDTLNCWYLKASGGGIFSLDVNGGTAANTSTNATLATATTAITGSLGANVYNAKYVSGGILSLLAMEAYNSAVVSTQVWNCGVGAVTTSDLVGATPQAASNFIQTIPSDLTLLNMGINDWNGGVTVGTYTTNMQTLITAGLANGGDVIIVTPTPTNPTFGGTASVATQKSFVQAMYGLASSNNIVCIDLFSLMVSYAVGQPIGFYYDAFHPDSIGYADQANLIANVLLAA